MYNLTLSSLVRIKEELLGVKIYGSRNLMSKTTGDIGGGEDPIWEKNKWSARKCVIPVVCVKLGKLYVVKHNCVT